MLTEEQKYARDYHARNRDRRNAARRARYAANPERENQNSRRYALQHPGKTRAAYRAYQTRNREKLRAAARVCRGANPERIRASRRAHYATHLPKILAYRRIRRQTNPSVRVTHNLRVRVWHAVRGIGKSAPTLKLLGCKIPELRAHLESRFRPGMTWENYGPVWHIDHIRACAKFDLLDPAQQRECFHYTNLQPLFAEENLKKGAR